MITSLFGLIILFLCCIAPLNHVQLQITADLDVRIVMDGLISGGVFDNKTWQLVEAEVRTQLHSARTQITGKLGLEK